jgi:hypothetical protein
MDDGEYFKQYQHRHQHDGECFRQRQLSERRHLCWLPSTQQSIIQTYVFQFLVDQVIQGLRFQERDYGTRTVTPTHIVHVHARIHFGGDDDFPEHLVLGVELLDFPSV